MDADPAGRRGGEGEPEEPAAGVRRDGHQAEPRGRSRFYETGIFELAGETPGAQRAGRAGQAGRRRPSRSTRSSSKTTCCRGRRATGGSARRSSPRSWSWSSTPASAADEVLSEAEAEADRVEREMYVIARQLWGTTVPRQAGAARRRRRPPARRSAASSTQLGKDHGNAETLVDDAKRDGRARSRRSSSAKDILRLPEPDRCRIIEMPEFQRGNSVAYLNPAPPLDPKAPSDYAISPPPRDWDAARGRELPARSTTGTMLQILTIHEAYPGHYVQLEYSQPAPVADPQGALLGRLRRGLGGLHRADDARPGLRRRRPGAAAAPVEVLPAGRGQRDPRPQDALHRA